MKIIKRVSVAVVALMFLVLPASAQKSDSFEIVKGMDLFGSIVKELQSFYVDTIDAQKVIEKGINSMLYSLDPYTTYIPEDKRDDFKLMTTGEYAGIGSLISIKDSVSYIVEVYEGNPAERDGLMAGDKIIAIDGEPMYGKLTTYVSDKLRGKANTKLTVTVKRGNNEQDIVITRAKIYIPAVTYYGEVGSKIGYIYVSSFNDKTTSEVKAALSSLKDKYKIESLIIDLRDNPGGIMSEAIDLVNLFVPKGVTVLETKGRVKEWNENYKTTSKPLEKDMPLAILVNGGSASASEIVAGALQDLDRAVVIGERTFGKGLVQSTRSLPYKGLLKFTSSKYYIPSGRLIQAIDYSNRDKNGRTTRIPDSLTTLYYTAAGRPVRDGRGISPDIEIENNEKGNIVYYMLRDLIIFDYATQYREANPQIAPIGEWELSDEEYDKFKEFVKSREFNYDKLSLDKLKELKEVAEFEGYFDDAADTFAQLEKQLEHNLDRDLDSFKDNIKRALQEEIIKRYYYTKGVIKSNLVGDEYTAKAIEILTNSEEYRAILSPKPNVAADKK